MDSSASRCPQLVRTLSTGTTISSVAKVADRGAASRGRAAMSCSGGRSPAVPPARDAVAAGACGHAARMRQALAPGHWPHAARPDGGVTSRSEPIVRARRRLVRVRTGRGDGSSLASGRAARWPTVAAGRRCTVGVPVPEAVRAEAPGTADPDALRLSGLRGAGGRADERHALRSGRGAPTRRACGSACPSPRAACRRFPSGCAPGGRRAAPSCGRGRRRRRRSPAGCAR